MANHDALRAIRTELEAGTQLAKCQKCGCMKETLENLAALLPTLGTDETNALARQVEMRAGKMEPMRYACLGCDYCYPPWHRMPSPVLFLRLGIHLH